MTRDAFMKELAYLLQDMDTEDRQDALQYYNDYFDEAGPDREPEIIKELGSPEQLASIIRSNLNGELRDGGEFTDTGYKDQRFARPGSEMPPAEQASGRRCSHASAGPETKNSSGPAAGEREQKPPFTSRPLKIFLWIVLLVLLFPVLLGVGGGLLSILVGIAGLLIGLFLILGLCTLAFLAAGIVLIPFGLAVIFSQPLSGLMTAGTGLIFLGGGLLLLSLSLLFYGRFIPFVLGKSADALDRLIRGRRVQL